MYEEDSKLRSIPWEYQRQSVATHSAEESEASERCLVFALCGSGKNRKVDFSRFDTLANAARRDQWKLFRK